VSAPHTVPEVIHAVGFAPWKRRHVRTFLQPSAVRFVRQPRQLPRSSPPPTAATWGVRIPDEAFPPGTRILRLEDGFLRSVGLGIDLTTPLSWVKDSRGIYYDATRPSDLEHLLACHDFTASLRDRAKALRQRIVDGGLTKYNVGRSVWQPPAGDRPVILVPGQVETDASIALGSSGIRTNTDLLQAVREARPQSYLVYKPHPDVEAGLRRRGATESLAANFCDEVVRDADMNSLLLQVDEVHTMTSLAGFEGLLRGKKVVTYGMPFYAGWGLTSDIGMIPTTAARRQRRLELPELVAGALILYPLYAGLVSRQIVPPEVALQELSAWLDRKPRKEFHLLRPILRLLSF
jgi:capsular polysaccharide export protein